MSLQLAANHLSAQGRGPDSTLVHMSPGEVQSLQQIAMAHGGSLSINPETGLPEAGFLKSILPMIAGAGLAMIPGVGPLMAAGLIGGGTTIATGSLQKGLMAGLGAYGGAGLAGGLMGAGTQAAANSAISGNLASTVGEPALAATQAAQAAQATPLATMGQGLTGLTETGGREAFMKSVGGTKGLLKSGLAAAAPMMMAGNSSQPPGIKPTAPTTPLQYNANPISPTPAPDSPGYGNQGQDSGRQRRYFNHQFTPITPPAPMPLEPITNMPINDVGGGMAAGGPVEEMSLSNAYAMQNARGGVSDMGIDAFTGMQRMAGGGISHLGDYSDGGRLLKGPGDGVSDDIPAMIGEKQPARLADGEFVIPARIVSELGNGSTEAGARKLYAMMDRIQDNRRKTIGDDNVAVDSKSDRYLPA
jgi:hypothetical protein